MSLSDKLAQRKLDSLNRIPNQVRVTMEEAISALKSSSIEKQAPKVGDKLIGFNLPNHHHEMVSLDSLLKKGPVIVTFYRGNWCPYCNLELQAYQSQVENIKKLGVTLVAIGPELPDESLSTVEKNQLQFQVLSDVNCEYARELGIAYSLDDALRPLYEDFGIDLQQRNGSFDLPVSATFVVDAEGIIIDASVDADYTHRKDPVDVIALLTEKCV